MLNLPSNRLSQYGASPTMFESGFSYYSIFTSDYVEIPKNPAWLEYTKQLRKRIGCAHLQTSGLDAAF